MSHVEVCKKHGQYHGEICGDCYEELKEENARLRDTLFQIGHGSGSANWFSWIARDALEKK
jgi:hypothetical protein